MLYSGFGGVGLASLHYASAGALFARSTQSRYHALQNVAMYVLVPTKGTASLVIRRYEKHLYPYSKLTAGLPSQIRLAC